MSDETRPAILGAYLDSEKNADKLRADIRRLLAERDDARRERDAAVRARAEAEAKLEGVRAAHRCDKGRGCPDLDPDWPAPGAQFGDGNVRGPRKCILYPRCECVEKRRMLGTGDECGTCDALDAHHSDALRALVERAARVTSQVISDGYLTDAGVEHVVARVLGGGR